MANLLFVVPVSVRRGAVSEAALHLKGAKLCCLVAAPDRAAAVKMAAAKLAKRGFICEAFAEGEVQLIKTENAHAKITEGWPEFRNQLPHPPDLDNLVAAGGVAINLYLFATWPQLLNAIREKPGMYTGGPSVTRLNLLLLGFSMAEQQYAIPEAERLGGFGFQSFEDWVAARYNPDGLSLNSYSLAREAAGSEEGGFRLWFQWYDEFGSGP